MNREEAIEKINRYLTERKARQQGRREVEGEPLCGMRFLGQAEDFPAEAKAILDMLGWTPVADWIHKLKEWGL